MSEKREKLSTVYVESLSKKAAGKFVFSGEIANSLNPEQVRADMTAAKESGGYVFIYKRKKEVRAICIFVVEKHEIPLQAAVVDEKKVASYMFKRKEAEDRVAEESVLSEMIEKSCFVMAGFYLAESYAADRDEYRKLFEKVAKEYMVVQNDKIPAYIWDDEIVMSNQVISNGKMVSATCAGGSIGMAIGAVLGILLHNMVWLLWGLVIGASLTAGTTKAFKSARIKEDDGEESL